MHALRVYASIPWHLDIADDPTSLCDRLRGLVGAEGPSGFGSATEAEEVAKKFASSAKGKTILVTGCTLGGLGFETARVLAGVGARVILHFRSHEKANTAVASIRTEFKHANVCAIVFDLARKETMKNVVEMYEQAVGKKTPLHILINNAGVMATPFQLKEGVESQFHVCHLGHFALFKALLPKLRLAAKSGYCRVVNVSSLAHRFLRCLEKDTIFKLESMNDRAIYSPWGAYGRSKLANVLFSFEIERRFGDQGIHSVSLHPGAILTNLFGHLAPRWLSHNRITQGIFCQFGKSIPQGSATTVFCALAPEVEENYGLYFSDCNVGAVHAWGLNASLASELWELSERLTSPDYNRNSQKCTDAKE